MFGKAYESMYEGSMMGAGLHVFAVWNYIIAKSFNPVIELNPELLAFKLGGPGQSTKEIEDALEFLQRPDPKSRSPLEGGRRLVKEGQFQYRVVNWSEYQSIRSEEELREYNRRKQAEYRLKKKSRPSPGETLAQRMEDQGLSEDAIAAATERQP